ncbi:MAG: peptidase M23 [Flavobacteriaceae bacterium]|nr:peptidase M23 [Flavobacteriaceae bacterium]|tara:strand:+ start:138227 stop:138895 length:669 start_codon:yes stop_codon:yes gene_type:complete
MNNLSFDGALPIDNSISFGSYCPIDLSGSNKDLDSFDTTSSSEWEAYVESHLQKNKAKVAYGGYLEVRNLYDRSDYFQAVDAESKRNIHLGIDYWCEASTHVCAIFDGTVHSFKNNTNYGDYGPTIILEHQENGMKFYSLYGHLSLASIESITVGDKIGKGENFAQLGDAAVNGDYAPHLHFQIIKDLQGNYGDYPGVSSKKNLEFYSKNCPNPLNYIKKNA